MSEKREELLNCFLKLKEIFEAKSLEKEEIPKLIERSTLLVKELIVFNQLHLGKF
jgi:hypothetical protein